VPDCSKPNVEQEPGPGIQPFVEPFTTKVEVDSEPSVIVEPNVLDETKSEVAAELVRLQEKTPRPAEVEKPLEEISADLPIELTITIELLPSPPAMRVPLSLSLSDIYDPLQIFLRQTGSQQIKFLMVQSTIGPISSGDNLPRHATCILLELPLIVVGLSRKPVPPPPSWFRYDKLMSVARPPPWPD